MTTPEREFVRLPELGVLPDSARRIRVAFLPTQTEELSLELRSRPADPAAAPPEDEEGVQRVPMMLAAPPPEDKDDGGLHPSLLSVEFDLSGKSLPDVEGLVLRYRGESPSFRAIFVEDADGVWSVVHPPDAVGLEVEARTLEASVLDQLEDRMRWVHAHLGATDPACRRRTRAYAFFTDLQWQFEPSILRSAGCRPQPQQGDSVHLHAPLAAERPELFRLEFGESSFAQPADRFERRARLRIELQRFLLGRLNRRRRQFEQLLEQGRWEFPASPSGPAADPDDAASRELLDRAARITRKLIEVHFDFSIERELPEDLSERLIDAFLDFANGELRLSEDEGTRRRRELNAEPTSGFFFLFAEFFLAAEARVRAALSEGSSSPARSREAEVWLAASRAAVAGQSAYLTAYGFHSSHGYAESLVSRRPDYGVVFRGARPGAHRVDPPEPVRRACDASDPRPRPAHQLKAAHKARIRRGFLELDAPHLERVHGMMAAATFPRLSLPYEPLGG